MNRDVIQCSLVQQLMGGSPNWWNMNNLRLQSAEQASPPVHTSSPPSSSSSSVFPQYPHPSQLLPIPSCHDSQELPDQSWIQLVMGGLVAEEDKSSFMVNPFQPKKVENWEDQILYPSSNALKHENTAGGFLCSQSHEDVQASRASWSQIMQASSPRSCISSSMLDFSNRSTERRIQQAHDHSSECNSTATAAPFKKARVQVSLPPPTTLKVRKEKLGDRITALHQIVSPFGKTDTASVLLEAIGYIRFLQTQIEALSSPYMGSGGSTSIMQPVKGERSCIFPEDPGQLLNAGSKKARVASDQEGNYELKRDLRSRGLCLVPLSCIMDVGSSNGADYWAPTLGGGFR